MTPLRIRSSFRIVLAHGRRVGIPMLYEGEESFPKINLCYDLVVITFLVYKVVCAIYALWLTKVFGVRLYVFSIAFYMSTGLFIISFFAICSNRFMLLVQRFDELTESLLNSGFGHEDVLVYRYNTAAKLVTNYSKVMSFMTVACPGLFSVSVPFFDFLEGRYRTRTAIPGQCPVELVVQGLPGVFEFIVIQQALGIFYPFAIRNTMDGMMLALFRIQSSFFEYLSKTIENIGNEVKLKRSSSKTFLKWIKLHQQVTINARELAHFFSPIIVMYYLSTIIIVAGPLIYVMDPKSVNFLQILFGGSGVLSALGQLYVQCHAAHDITIKGENIAFPVYSMPWTEYNQKVKNLVKMIITTTNHPIYIEGYCCPAFRLNKVTYQALFLNVVSTFMAFRKIKEMNELEGGAAG